jgi:uncharacterized damage-inducible protein DinB
VAYAFLADTYRTEILKTLTVWSQVPDDRLSFRPEPRARTPLEHMVHQCVSEENWMRSMLGILVDLPALPAVEGKQAFLQHYAAAARRRLEQLTEKDPAWFEQETTFFDVQRSHAWVLTRRIAHSAHHRGQLTVYLRLWSQALYSTYGPTADTGGLPLNGARVVYRYESIDDLLDAEASGGRTTPLPGPGVKSPTERG